jgi:hypothetical protein
MKFIVNMACGLANRMFQYSYYLFLKKQGYDVAVDFYHSAKLAHEKVAWNAIFPHAEIKQALRLKIFLWGGGADICSKIRRKYFPWSTNVKTMSGAFDASLPVGMRGQYIIGVFLNAAIVEAVGDEVKRCFSFLPFSDKMNLRIEQKIKECESVAIHVRKGKDYQSRIWYQNTCTMEYYQKAVALLKEKIQNPRFYIFTDNVEWVKENFQGMDFTLVEGNPVDGYGSHFDMQLMSLCKHNIISNSTYSWWSAFLNHNSNKIVIAPKVWFNPDSCDEFKSDKALCKGWIAL